MLYSHICLRRLAPDMQKEWKQATRIGAILQHVAWDRRSSACCWRVAVGGKT